MCLHGGKARDVRMKGYRSANHFFSISLSLCSPILDSTTTNGEHAAADPLGGGRGGSLPRAARVRDGLVAGGRHLVRHTRLPPRATPSRRPLDHHRAQLRQVYIATCVYIVRGLLLRLRAVGNSPPRESEMFVFLESHVRIYLSKSEHLIFTLFSALS